VQAQTRFGSRAWFVAGLIVAAILAPAATVAAASLIQIQGSNGNVANVDPAHQVLVAESDPAAFHTSGYPETDTTPGCVVVDARPATKALILRQVRFWVKAGSPIDASHGLIVFPNRTCVGSAIAIYIPSHLGSETETFEPGWPIRAGAGVSIQAFGSGLTAETSIFGYTVAPAAVP
jgi:hypothetical protein